MKWGRLRRAVVMLALAIGGCASPSTNRGTVTTPYSIDWLLAIGQGLVEQRQGRAMATTLGRIERESSDRVHVALEGGGTLQILLEGAVASQVWIHPGAEGKARLPSLAALEARFGAPIEGPRTSPLAPLGLSFRVPPVDALRTPAVQLVLLAQVDNPAQPRAEWHVGSVVVLTEPRLR